MKPAIDECYWTAAADDRRSPPLNGHTTADFAIIGGGIVGVVAARLLKDRGHRVAVVEAGRAGHGVTGRSTAKVTAQHSLFLHRIEDSHGAEAARVYAEFNRAGVGLIAHLVRREGLACDFEPADSFVYATTTAGREKLEEECAAANKAGLPMDIVADAGLPYPIDSALRLPDQAQFQPANFVAELAATLPGDGSDLFEDSQVIDWSETEVRTDQGSISARNVIMATHLPLGQVGNFHASTSPHMHAVMAVPVEAGRAPAGMHISIDEPKRSLRRHRAADGATFMILTGPTFKHGDAEAEAQGFAELAEFARDHFGYQGGGYRWTNEDYTPSDGLPFIGWSDKPGKSLLVATGFDAWGLSSGAAAALILADLCEARDNDWAKTFDASRHSLRGFGKSVANTGKVAGDLIGGHLRNHAERDPATADEGEIVDVEGRAAGIYRADDGSVRAVSAVCTHMGCKLGWNPVDRTWDCACHGSRFAADGQVVHGPAVERLAPVEWTTD